MRNIFIYIITGLTLLVSGCSNSTQIENEDGDFFSKKMKCSTIISEIEQRQSFKNQTDKDTSAWVDRIFYSPKTDSCIYLMITSNSPGNGTFVRGYFLKDGLTEKTLHSTSACFPTIQQCSSISDADLQVEQEIAKYE